MTHMHITKTGEEHYHATVNENFTLIDENVNDLQLLGMLTSKDLVGPTPCRVMGFLNRQKIGYKMTVTYE
jgi:hypothetical protein